MAESRKRSTDRRERLLGIAYGFSGGRTANPDISELSEEDVWPSAPADESPAKDDSSYDTTETASAGRSGESWLARREQRHVGGLSLVFEELSAHHRRVQRHRRHCYATGSAPVNVPDWSKKMLRDESIESLHGIGGEVDDDQGPWLPPHEYLARQHGRSMVTTSVFEGIGRTLKGRDMSRVRDAVWSQTGFFG